jgi:hypothetical protein
MGTGPHLPYIFTSTYLSFRDGQIGGMIASRSMRCSGKVNMPTVSIALRGDTEIGAVQRPEHPGTGPQRTGKLASCPWSGTDTSPAWSTPESTSVCIKSCSKSVQGADSTWAPCVCGFVGLVAGRRRTCCSDGTSDLTGACALVSQ